MVQGRNIRGHCIIGYIFIFSDITDFEPDANMVFNYLMMSALAEAADAIEKKGIKKPSGGTKHVSFFETFFTINDHILKSYYS